MEQVVAVQIEAAPSHRRLRCALQELTRRIAEELRDVDTLDLALRCGSSAAPGARRATAEDVGEEVVEEAAAAAEPARHPLLGQIDVAEILDFLRSVGAKPHPRRNCGSSVTLTNGLVGCSHSKSSSGGWLRFRYLICQETRPHQGP